VNGLPSTDACASPPSPPSTPPSTSVCVLLASAVTASSLPRRHRHYPRGGPRRRARHRPPRQRRPPPRRTQEAQTRRTPRGRPLDRRSHQRRQRRLTHDQPEKPSAPAPRCLELTRFWWTPAQSRKRVERCPHLEGNETSSAPWRSTSRSIHDSAHDVRPISSVLTSPPVGSRPSLFRTRQYRYFYSIKGGAQ
jgi:hypothetical protein